MTSQPSNHPLGEQIGCGAASLVALLVIMFGLFSIYDAAFSGGSGEWGSFAQTADLVLDIPAGLIVLALAFTQHKGRRRTFIMILAGTILLIPVVTSATRHFRAAAYSRELQNMMQHRTPTVPSRSQP